MTIDASHVTITTTAEEGDNLVTRDGAGQVISSTPLPPERVNAKTIETKAIAAIDANQTWLGNHATRQAAIDQMVADATAGKSATVANVTQAQTAVRQLSDLCLRLSTALDQTEVLLQSTVKQLTAVERLIVSRLDSTDGT